MIWQQGGEVLDKANKKALFAGPQGVKALQLLSDMALKDKSLYPDQTPDTQKMYGLFDSGKMAMIVTGPWQLSDIRDHHVSYGVQVHAELRRLARDDLGPGRLHGLQPLRRAPGGRGRRSWPGCTSPRRTCSGTSAAATCRSARRRPRCPAFKAYAAKYPGVDLFVKNLANAHHIRPPVPQYTQISVAVGKAIATSLLGRGSPKDTLAQAAKTADKALG